MHPILAELRHLDTGRAALRRFGLVVGAVFAGLGAWIFYRHGGPAPGALVAGGVGVVLVVLGALAPPSLRIPYRVWMAVAFAMGFVMTRVLLTVVFFAIVTPIGWAMRLVGHDAMRRRRDPDAGTYWISRDDAPEKGQMTRPW